MGQCVFIFRVKQSVNEAMPDDRCIIGVDDGVGGDSHWMGLWCTGSDVEGWLAGD